ncbi:MAG: transposase [Myxococcales bacterium]|nr:transposase [Myxococcales bacterium]USN51544.1 MAG: transposase [Myxococcales bacterium]
MSHLYETCLSDAAWEVIEPISPADLKNGRLRFYSVRSIVDAILYVLKNACMWRCLPNDFPSRGIVYHYFRCRSISGL